MSRTSPKATMPTIDMFEQLTLERHALRILAMPQVQEQKRAVETLYRQNWLGETPDGRARLENAANVLAYFSAQFAVADDSARPRMFWTFAAPHTWHDIDVPGTGFGIDNPDNFYRWLAIDGASRYEITGRRTGPGPGQQTFLVYNSVPGTTTQTLEGATVTGSLQDSDLTFAADGSFTIIIGGEPGPPGTAHLPTTADSRLVVIRDTLVDWNVEFPHELRIQRIGGPPARPPKSDAQLADEAAQLLKLQAPYWLAFWQAGNYNNPANTAPPLLGRSGGWGFVCPNWFQFADDEALVITISTLSAIYVNLQIADPWSITPDYIDHTSGLNNAQCKPNKDGTYTFVIAARDPGVWNWVDTVGLHVGLFTIRWQRVVDPNPDVATGVREAKVVKLAELKKTLPAETVWVNAAERKAQLAERAATYLLRLAH